MFFDEGLWTQLWPTTSGLEVVDWKPQQEASTRTITGDWVDNVHWIAWATIVFFKFLFQSKIPSMINDEMRLPDQSLVGTLQMHPSHALQTSRMGH